MSDYFKKIIAHDKAKAFYDEQIALGDVLANSTATLEIDGYGHLSVNTKSFSDIMPTATDGMEIFMLGGILRKQVSQIKIVAENIPVTIYETTRGQVETMMLNIRANGGKFDCTFYEGTPDSYVWAKKYKDCKFASLKQSKEKEVIAFSK